MKVSALWRYPIKSCRGTQHDSLEVTKEGFLGDRRYQWVLENGRFVTQREFPLMSQLAAQYKNDELECLINDRTFQIPDTMFGDQREVSIWGDKVLANLYQGELNAEVSEFLGFQVQLVKLPQQGRKISDPVADGHVSFADGLPYLLTNQQSLNDLNARLAKEVSMLNFRPNIVVEAKTAFEEDGWQELQIGEVRFKNVKPCKRCVLTTVDPDTGIKSNDAEPLKTLAAYRQPEPGNILFGINLVSKGEGVIKVGDTVKLL